ncbi:sigma-E processing peptidase SpoIIGA [Rossellomorea vietnamensis]|uniref:Sigma-E processing peptidase SpoIIGA n=1 Tax=Rossellomorea vietnamensis TaxID=218284 RepID=A0ACD4CA01_9BACI|nr:sigma-E processing peptidase SpoIIGA [Rossellomorea vietnamensis]UXH45494.1 sigma-E processing peptidase SpoIIGA [Rossellomorea vietnamensis]
MTLYLDVIWLLNLLVDFFLLWLTGIILKRQYALWRIAIGSLIGSVIILLAFSPFAHFTGNPLVKLLFSVVMVYSAFGYRRWRHYMSNLLMFYFVTFFTGGILIGTHYFISFDPSTESSMLLASIRGFGDPISWVFVMLALPLAWYFSKGRVDSIEHVKLQYDQLLKVKIQIDDFHCTVNGLVDSGNQLQDPISKSPVMILSIAEIEGEIPDEMKALCHDVDDIFSGEKQIDTRWSDRMRIVPAQSVGRSSQLLAAIKPDSLVLSDHEAEWTIPNGLVAFREEPLSADGQFGAIVHPKMAARKPVLNVS